jgi:hypothetical protein
MQQIENGIRLDDKLILKDDNLGAHATNLRSRNAPKQTALSFDCCTLLQWPTPEHDQPCNSR